MSVTVGEKHTSKEKSFLKLKYYNGGEKRHFRSTDDGRTFMHAHAPSWSAIPERNGGVVILNAGTNMDSWKAKNNDKIHDC